MTKKTARPGQAEPRIKRSTVNLLIEQNRAMRELLLAWPGREIMMDFEKEWNEQREKILRDHPEINLES